MTTPTKVTARPTVPVPIKVEATIARAGIPGARGVPGPAGGAVHEHVQAVPSAVWTVQHNLGARPSSVRVLDAEGRQLLTDVADADLNTTVITHATPTTGRVIVAV